MVTKGSTMAESNSGFSVNALPLLKFIRDLMTTANLEPFILQHVNIDKIK